MSEAFDLSTPEGRLERGVYDEAVDPFISDEIRIRAANYIRENDLSGLTAEISVDTAE